MKKLLPLTIILLATAPAQADDFFVETVPQPWIEWDEPPVALQKKHPDSHANAIVYPKIDIRYVRTSIPAIDAVLNHLQNEIIANTSCECEQATNQENAAEAGKLFTIPSAETFSKWANQFALAQWTDYDSVYDSVSWRISSNIEYQGHYNDLELFAENTSAYTGGAHPNFYTTYYVFNHQGKQITFTDLLISPDKLADIQPLLKPGTAAYVRESKINYDNEINVEKDFFPGAFANPAGDENFTFTQDGIKILYQPYEIAPFAYGMPYTILPYDKLKGIVKDEYLPENGAS